MPEEMPNSSKENFELARINWLITIMKFPNLPSSQKCPPSRKFWLNKALSLTSPPPFHVIFFPNSHTLVVDLNLKLENRHKKFEL